VSRPKLYGMFLFLGVIGSTYSKPIAYNNDVIECSPMNFVCPNRFDIMAKYIYAKYREFGVRADWPLEVYKEHIHVWGNYIEIGKVKPEKVGFDEYLLAFHNILDSIKEGGFDRKKSIIPIGKQGIRNGSHRVTACLLYNKKFWGRYDNKPSVRASADYFKKRTKHVSGGLAEKYLDAMALQYCELKKKQVHVLLVASKNTNEFTGKKIVWPLDSLVYHKKSNLTKQGILNVSKILKASNILRNADNLSNCFLLGDAITVEVFLFDVKKSQWPGFNLVINRLKNDAVVIYVSKKYQQALTLCQTFFNSNSLDFINNNVIDDYKKFDRDICRFKKLLKMYGVSRDMCCLYIDDIALRPGSLKVIYHDEEAFRMLLLKYKKFVESHTVNKDVILRDNIIFNPQNYFYYRNIKIVNAERFLL
jgi:hypothetical protein